MGVFHQLPEMTADLVMNLLPVGAAGIGEFLVAQEPMVLRRLANDGERLLEVHAFADPQLEFAECLQEQRCVGGVLAPMIGDQRLQFDIGQAFYVDRHLCTLISISSVSRSDRSGKATYGGRGTLPQAASMQMRIRLCPNCAPE